MVKVDQEILCGKLSQRNVFSVLSVLHTRIVLSEYFKINTSKCIFK